MGFKKQFETDTKFNVNIRAFAAISLLPVGDDLEGFVELKKVPGVPPRFIKYFEDTYIGEPFGRRGKRKTPLYPIEIWNTHARLRNISLVQQMSWRDSVMLVNI